MRHLYTFHNEAVRTASGRVGSYDSSTYSSFKAGSSVGSSDWVQQRDSKPTGLRMRLAQTMVGQWVTVSVASRMSRV